MGIRTRDLSRTRPESYPWTKLTAAVGGEADGAPVLCFTSHSAPEDEKWPVYKRTDQAVLPLASRQCLLCSALQEAGLPRWHNRLARRTYSQYLLAMSHAEVVSSSLTRGTVLRHISCSTVTVRIVKWPRVSSIGVAPHAHLS